MSETGKEQSLVEDFGVFVERMRPLMLTQDGSDDPHTTPEILGNVRSENLWHSYFSYLIDPNGSHGFGDRFFEAFLAACETCDALSRNSTTIASDQIKVENEVGTEAGRIPDVLIHTPDWFLLLELKVDAPEGDSQTEDYANAGQLGPIQVKDFEQSARNFGFVAPDIPGSIDDAFTGIRWQEILSEFKEVQNELALSNYPIKSVVQLDDFIETLETTMPEIDDTTRKRAQCYLNHREEIEAARDAAETFVQDVLQYKWTEILENPQTAPSFWDETWYIQAQGNHYGQYSRDSWELENGLDVHFEHFPELAKFQEGKLVFRLDLEAPRAVRTSGKDPREGFRQEFISMTEFRDFDIDDHTIDDGEGDMDVSHALIRKEYWYEPGSEQGYYDTLLRAAEDHAELIPIVDSLFDSGVAENQES